MICLSARLSIPDSLKAKATYALRELCHRMGFGLRVAETGICNFHYVLNQPAADRENIGSILLRCNPSLYEARTLCRTHSRNNKQIWEAVDLGLDGTPDLVGGAYRLLALLDESQIQSSAQSQHTMFTIDELPESRRVAVRIPLIEMHAELLAEMIMRSWPNAKPAPRWPGNYTHACLLTHDCDHVDVGAPMELAANIAKCVLRPSADQSVLVRLGFEYLWRPLQNPFFCFDLWRRWEERIGIRSAFFLFVRPRGVPFGLNDCRSTMAGRTADWRVFRLMAEQGWEFGLHASVRSRDYPWAFSAAREWLEQRIGGRIAGVRHHYLALDWAAPYLTHRAHAEAGFEYDSSLLYRDAAGFRTGTSLPHQVFDPSCNGEIDFLQLPCALMDSHALQKDVRGTPEDFDVATAKALEIIQRVRQSRGMLMLNWHQESACNLATYRGFLDLIERLLPECVEGGAWMITPRALCSYWKNMGRQLDRADESLTNDIFVGSQDSRQVLRDRR